MNFRKSKNRSRKNSMNFVVNTEKWRNYGKKMSIRGSGPLQPESEDDDDDNVSLYDSNDWEKLFSSRRPTECKSDQDIEIELTKKQTLILATLVPDEILLMDKLNSPTLNRFVGVLLMADVSGYTALSERYHNTGKGGTYRLTVTLNTYLGSLLELIYSHGGDVLKFAGDAFLALWKTDKKSFLSHTIHTAIACALLIQHSYSSYETDVKVSLKVKLAISAGNLLFAPIGTDSDMTYVIFGLPVIEAKIAESLCTSGEVKLTPTAWGHCYSRNYDHVIHDDEHVTIKSILYDPRESDVTKPFLGFGTIARQTKKAFTAIENLPDQLWGSQLNVHDSFKKKESLHLRKSILVAEDRNIGSLIRKFMIQPVLTQIDAHQPLEYLTEMRRVSILFITLKPRICPYPQLITIVNNSYQITNEIVYKSMGCVNKIILFDKDVMILVIFGLRGFKHESEAQAALKCAYGIRKSVSALDGVLEVSIGITTGQVYCGVVGHPLRREFTVIGSVVNKAARLMCTFRNKITCDETTFIKSKMSSNGFKLQPKTKLKGIRDAGKIYEYSEEIRVKELYDILTIPPLLDRSDEIEYFENWLDDHHISYREYDALLLIGESRIGKSSLLEWLEHNAKSKQIDVCHVSLTSVHSATPYLALSQIVNQILELKDPIHGFEKEEKIVQLLKNYNEDLCYLNKILKVSFAYHEGMYSLDEDMRKAKAKNIFLRAMSSLEDVKVLFFDDLQNLDPSSWEFILLMLKVPKIFIVFTVNRGKFNAVHDWLYEVFINTSVRKLVIGPLSHRWIPPIACQILDVDAVPNDLCNALKMKCKGMPGLIENFIVHMFSCGALEVTKIKSLDLEKYKDEDLQFPKAFLLKPQALEIQCQKTLDELQENNATGEVSICVVTKKEELNTNINEQNSDAFFMIQIDSLTPYQQLLLKIASVIGNIFARELLENIMYENRTLTTAKAIKRLFSMRILVCANVKYSWSRRLSSALSVNLSGGKANSNLTCDCNFDYDPAENNDLPKYAFCKVIKFRNKNSRKTCYELLPMNQKKEFHSRIVNFLENNEKKCIECGGVLTVVQSIYDLDDRRNTQYSLYAIRDNETDSSGANSSDEINYSQKGIPLNSTESNIEPKRIKSNSSYSKSNVTKIQSETTLHSSYSTSSIKSVQNPILKYKNEDENAIRRSTKRVTMTSLKLKYQTLDSPDSLFIDKLREVTEAQTNDDWQKLGAVDSDDEFYPGKKNRNNNSFNIKIEKGVSKTNFSHCSCAELKILTFEQLVEHASQADMKRKKIEFLLSYCHLNLIKSNLNVAIEGLNDAELCCLELISSEEGLSKFDQQMFLGKLYTLKASACLLSGMLTIAKSEIERASRIYKINLNKVSLFLKPVNLKKKYRIQETAIKSESVFCLNIATMIYSLLGDEKMSRSCANRALKLIQKVECNIVDVCDAFSNALQVELDRCTPENTIEVEILAVATLKNLQHPFKSQELYSLGKLFMTTFRARLARSQLSSAIRAAFRALVISSFLYADPVTLDIIPELFYVLLSRRRIQEAVEIAQQILYLASRDTTIEYETWYYALCMDLILDAGFQLESPNEISRFADHAVNRTNSPGRRRLIVSLWTYWLRVDVERRARRYEHEALSWASRAADDDDTLTSLLSAMRLSEGMLESLARKMDDLRKVVDLLELKSLADTELTRLENHAKVCRTIYPRWLLLKSNSLRLAGRTTQSSAYLNHATEEALRIRNRLEEALAQAAASNSQIWLQCARVGIFFDWKVGKEQVYTSWHQLMYKITTTR